MNGAESNQGGEGGEDDDGFGFCIGTEIES